jgi:hypothetical protein
MPSTDSDTPSTEDIDLAKELAREIQQQADGTKQSEREKIKRMAGIAERLLDGTATDEERQQGRDELHPSRQR